MDSIDEIQSALERLTATERAGIALWLRTQWNETGFHVSEPRPAYNADPGSRYMSKEEYLDWDPGDGKYEYITGAVFAMSGTTLRHGMISENLAAALRNHLHGSTCRVFSAGIKVHMKLNRDDVFYCPDISVACGKIDPDARYLSTPKLIVEVLSPSTETIDRREKALHYRQIETLEEYVLVAQRAHEITIYRRSEAWKRVVLNSGAAIVNLRSIALEMPVSQMYSNIS